MLTFSYSDERINNIGVLFLREKLDPVCVSELVVLVGAE